MINGSCLCGRVAFRLSNKPRGMGFCHCSRCRKAAGSHSSAIVLCSKDSFEWISGEDLVETYVADIANALRRSFCKVCGSYLGEPYAEGKYVILAASTFDDDPIVRPSYHEHVADKALWYEFADDLPKYEHEPRFDADGSLLPPGD